MYNHVDSLQNTNIDYVCEEVIVTYICTCTTQQIPRSLNLRSTNREIIMNIVDIPVIVLTQCNNLSARKLIMHIYNV